MCICAFYIEAINNFGGSNSVTNHDDNKRLAEEKHAQNVLNEEKGNYIGLDLTN